MGYICMSVDGKETDASHAIFPILKQVDAIWKMVGTGFFISNTGIFVTAKHVIEDVLDKDGKPMCPICGFQLLEGDKYAIRDIIGCQSNTKSDVAVGVLRPMTHKITAEPLYNKIIPLATLQPRIGSRVVTYAYPESTVELEEQLQTVELQARFYDGRLEEYYPNGRDSSMLPFPCYRGSVRILGGASGGPVLDEKSRAFGVNCTGIDGTDIGFFARINEIFALSVGDVNLNGVHRDEVSIIELAEGNKIICDPPINRNDISKR